jgi:streptomycin 6-kinase
MPDEQPLTAADVRGRLWPRRGRATSARRYARPASPLPLADLVAPNFAAAGSPDGRAWMAALPATSGRLARQWDLTFTSEEFRHGYNAVVLFATQGGRPLALKLTWPPDQARGEADALAAWRAQGVVELVACDLPRGALLLERLDASRSLASIPLDEAAATAGALVRTLATEAPRTFPSLQAAARRLAATFAARQRSLQDPVPGEWVRLAARLAAALAQDPVRCLVHTDLHYDNILASDRPGQQWVAIDPAPAVGAPERTVAELLWTRADELPGPQAITSLLGTLADNGQLDPAKAAAWGFVRTIDYWLWGLENGLTSDPLRCQRIANALAPTAEQGNLPLNASRVRAPHG